MEVALLPQQIQRPQGLSREYSTNKIKLIRGGREYFDLLIKLIDEARESIHLQTYIYDDDETGKEVGERLTHAARRGVKVYLLVDGYASQSLSAPFVHTIQDAGINFRFFEPVFRSKYFYFGRRLHHKIFVSDTKYALVGGINISNRYNDRSGEPPWLDFALYVEGAIARELCVLCYKTWRGFPRKMELTPCELTTPRIDTSPGEDRLVRMRRNDWVRRKNEISSTYLEMLRNARRTITILCSYFLPGHEIRNQLIKAAQKGVKIRIIMSGRSDVGIVKPAERFIYNDLLENNIEIYEYQKTILHGKIMVCDSQCMTIGSYNVNNISAYASIELNLDVYHAGFASEINNLLNNIAEKDCIQITKEWLQKKQTTFERLIEWGSYELIRFLFYLFTFYFKQQP